MKKTLNILFLILYSNLIVFTGQAASLDSLEQLLVLAVQEKQPVKQTELYVEMGELAYSKRNYPKAIEQFNRALDLIKEQSIDVPLSPILMDLGKSYNKNDNYKEAISTFLQLVKIEKPINGEILDKIYHYLSKAYQNAGNTELAYEYGLKALELRETRKDLKGILRSTYQLGGIFFYQGNYKMALEYYHTTKKLAIEQNEKKYCYNSLAAIGGSLSRLGRFDEAIIFDMEAYELAKEMDYALGLAYSTHNIGTAYYEKMAYDTALVFFQKSLEIKKKLNDRWGQTASLRYIGNTYFEMGNFEKCIEFMTTSLELAKTIQSLPRLIEGHDALADTYEKMENWEAAYFHRTKYAKLRDSLITETTTQKLGDTKTRYEVQQSEMALQEKDKQMELTFRYGALGVFGLLGLLIWSLISRNRHQIEVNEVLTEKNQQIQEQNQQLAHTNEQLELAFQQIREQNKKLENSNMELQRFAFIASHDLKEPLRTIGSYANLLKRRYKNRLDTDANEFLDFITSGVGRMYNLLNDVLAFSRLEEKETESEIINVHEVINIVRANLGQQIKDKQAILNIQPALPNILMDSNHLSQVLQNLISNGIKFSTYQPTIEIACENRKGFHIFSVSDNGIGIEKKYQEKIFEMFQRLDRQYDGTGIGLAVCKKIINQYGGDIWVESTEGKGSTFYFSVPVTEVGKTQNQAMAVEAI